MIEPDDELLLIALRAGRPEACAAVVKAHYQTVYRFLVHLTRDVHQAEDLTQETFATVWQKSASFQGRAALTTWLHRIAYTKFIDAQRRRQSNARSLERATSPRTAPIDPLDIITADDEQRRLYRALQQLDPDSRTLLVLHYFQGLSYREMSTVFDEPTGTLKWRTAEALKRLRALLNEEISLRASRTTF